MIYTCEQVLIMDHGFMARVRWGEGGNAVRTTVIDSVYHICAYCKRHACMGLSLTRMSLSGYKKKYEHSLHFQEVGLVVIMVKRFLYIWNSMKILKKKLLSTVISLCLAIQEAIYFFQINVYITREWKKKLKIAVATYNASYLLNSLKRSFLSWNIRTTDRIQVVANRVHFIILHDSNIPINSNTNIF